MTYYPNIPQATDVPSQSQPLILSNFQQLNIQYGTSGDHVPFTALSNNGQHDMVTFVPQGSDPVAQPTQPIVYCKTTTYPGPITRSDLYLETSTTDGSGVGKIVQLTNLSNVNIDSPTFIAPITKGGFTFLPGGYIMQWGTFTSAGPPTVVTFPTPFLTQTQSVTISSGINSTVTAVGLTSFTFGAIVGTATAYFMAIGK